MKDYYKILQVDYGAEPEAIKRAYRVLSRKWHPDHNPDHEKVASEKMRELNEAYEVLSDPRKRADYDFRLRQEKEDESIDIHAIQEVVGLCQRAEVAAEALPDQALSHAIRLIGRTRSLTLGLSRESARMAEERIAYSLNKCAVIYGNATSKWSACIPILERALGMAYSSEARAVLTENLATARSNTVYENIEPVTSAPSLHTINGIGTTLYGASDRDPATGSVMMTYYFTVLFIPVFPICRYRVIPQDGSYLFLGKAPLRDSDKLHLGISIAVIIVLIIWLMVAGSSSY
ncbi:MAG: hypothetical protein B1H03_01795 [Planctomycetales bacterium 4484_113]|nr:MAG: hypothetical protein B1H03_01795 [Planctomycetales bacterium 4484_113]